MHQTGPGIHIDRRTETLPCCFFGLDTQFLSITHSFSHSCIHSVCLTVIPFILCLPVLGRPTFLGSDVNALPIRLSIKQPCTTRSSGQPKPWCMQIRLNCSAMQTPWNLLSGGREWTCQKYREKWAPAHLFYANENNKAKHYTGLSVS